MKHYEITSIRLGSWKQKLAEDKATPVLMIGVIDEGPNKNHLVLLTTEDIDAEEIQLHLQNALKQLKPHLEVEAPEETPPPSPSLDPLAMLIAHQGTCRHEEVRYEPDSNTPICVNCGLRLSLTNGY